MIFFRIAFSVLLVISGLLIPWWFAALLLLFGFFIFDSYVEGILVAGFFDVIFSGGHGFAWYYTSGAVVFLVSIEAVKKRLLISFV